MGTRGLYCVLQDQQLKVAQYGQWSSNPGGYGLTVRKFLADKIEDGSLDDFRKKVATLHQWSEEDVEALWAEFGADERGSLSNENFERLKSEHPSLSRDVCGDIYQLIANGDVTHVRVRDGFAADSLFCEWAYVVNLDDNVLEVFKGFQEEPHDKGRFADYEVEEGKHDRYWPVAEVARFEFSSLPDEDAFVAICEGNVLDRLAHLEHEPPQ